MYIDTDGFISFGVPTANDWISGPIPSSAKPNAALYPFWDDLMVDGSASVLTKTTGTAPNRQYIVEWRNVFVFDHADHRFSFEAIISENGDIAFAYTGDMTAARPRAARRPSASKTRPGRSRCSTPATPPYCGAATASRSTPTDPHSTRPPPVRTLTGAVSPRHRHLRSCRGRRTVRGTASSFAIAFGCARYARPLDEAVRSAFDAVVSEVGKGDLAVDRV